MTRDERVEAARVWVREREVHFGISTPLQGYLVAGILRAAYPELHASPPTHELVSLDEINDLRFMAGERK